jgi:Zn-dependent alcohol dehydrogenase
MGTAARVVVLPAGRGQLRVEDVVLPDPGPHQVVVKQFASGICHSQLHQMHRPRTEPRLLGHESTGVVVAAGSEVNHVREGDRVVVTWLPRAAGINRLPEVGVVELAGGGTASTTNVFTWADATIADEQFVVPLRDGVSTDVTSIIGCAVMTGSGAVLRTAGVQPGDSVAVFGVGGVGLSAIVAAAVIGADPVIAVDLRDDKLQMARRFGATETVDASVVDAVAAIHDLTRTPRVLASNGQPVSGVDYAFDCIGVETTLAQIVAATRTGTAGRRGGTAVVVGVPSTGVTVGTTDLLLDERTLIGSLGGSCLPDRDFPVFLDWYEDGRLDLDSLVTARYRIDQINEATTDLAEGRISGRSILVFD